MSVWGIVGGGKIKTELLDHLGLTCYGGGGDSVSGKITYHITNEDDSFNVYLTEKELNNIDQIYKKHKRKLLNKKLKKCRVYTKNIK